MPLTLNKPLPVSRHPVSAPYVVETDFEITQFKRLQQNFAGQFESAFPDKMALKTVVVAPGLSLDAEILQKIDGIHHYEERLLCLLLLLRMPQTRIIYITSMPVDPAIVDYYLHLLPGITAYHARQRLTFFSCYDASTTPLTKKILNRPRLLQRIKESIPDKNLAHLACFNVTDDERKLSVALQIPVYGCDPDLQRLGNKSNGRRLFQECGIAVAPGFEDLYHEEDAVQALCKLKRQNPALQKAVLKLNEGFSGEGNAVFLYAGAPQGKGLVTWIREQLPRCLQLVASGLSYDGFMKKMGDRGGVVEAFLDGNVKFSPSVQCRINPLGKIDVISTHDQRLGGENGQIYLGASFPAKKEYARPVAEMGRKVAEALRFYGVLGRFGVDFISLKKRGEWQHYAIEINLRKGGTTHPYLLLQFLTAGEYVAEEGMYYAANGQPRYYVCTDNLVSEHYKGLTPHDLIDIAMCNDLLYDESSQEGVMFHLIGALSQYGKLGLVCIGSSPERADYYYRKTVEVLNREGRR